MKPLFWNIYGKDHELYFYEIDEGYGLSLGLVEMNEDGFPEPWTDVTVVIPESLMCEDDEAFIKNWSENEGIDDWLVENGIAVCTGTEVQTGYVSAPIMKFDLDKVREHSLYWR